MRILPFLFLFTVIFNVPAFAGVKVGEKFPIPLELKDHSGVAQSYDALKGAKGAVLIFVRSVDWCPYCQVQLLDLRDDGSAVTDLGYNIVAISYDAPALLEKFKERYGFPYTLLSDEGSAAIKALGILNEKFPPDHFAHGVPHPTVYVVNAQGDVQAVLSEEGHKRRPQAEVIVNTIKSLD